MMPAPVARSASGIATCRRIMPAPSTGTSTSMRLASTFKKECRQLVEFCGALDLCPMTAFTKNVQLRVLDELQQAIGDGQRYDLVVAAMEEKRRRRDLTYVV